MTRPQRFKAPAITKLGRPHWEAARRGKLAIQHCLDCGKYVHYPSCLCERCLSENLEWKEVSGRGTIESFSTVYRPFSPEFAADVPYTVALVRLDEDLLLLSWLSGVAPDAVSFGMKVQVTFEQISDEIFLHRFRPVLA
jgi:uncharacterized OB-fold protein